MHDENRQNIKMIENKERDNLERFHYAMDATKDGIWDWNIITGEVYYSPGYLRMLGYEEGDAEYNAEFWMSRIAPEYRESVLAANMACINNEVPSFEVEFKMQTRNGQWRWILGRGKAVERDKNKKATRMVGTHVDITQIKETEAALKSSENRFQKMLSAIPDLVSIHDTEMNVIYSNWKGFGNVPDHLRLNGGKCYSLYRGYSEVCPGCQARKVIATKKEIHLESELPDGTWVELRVIPILDKDNSVEMFVEWVRVITDRKRIEKELAENESKYRGYVDNAPAAIFVVDEKGNYLEHNYFAAKLTGYSSEELLQMRVGGLVLPEDLPKAMEHFQTVKATGKASTVLRVLNKAGARMVLRVEAVKLAENRYISFSTDLTQIFEAEESLKIAHETYKGILNSVSEMIYIQDQEGRFLDVNDAVIANYGYSRDEVIGKMPGFLAAEGKNNLHELGKKFNLAFAGQNQRMEFWGRKKDGNIFPKELSLAPGVYFGQRVVIAVARDITDQKNTEVEREKLQSQLLQIQKMDSVGRLAGGVAHDFNNMLNVILGHADLALDKLIPSHPLAENLNEIRHAASRSADLTRQLLAFARKQTAVPKILNLNETVAGMLKMLRRLIGENIELVWKPSENLWPVKIDPSQLDQILANLCVNARDAIAENGMVEISTENVIVSSKEDPEFIELLPGKYILLTVKDNGHGMSQETIDQLFEPFFTTKDIGKGTGLGLATVYGIVKQNNGLIKVGSAPGAGAKFEILLPSCGEDSEILKEKSEEISFPQTSSTVLFVEDEQMILNMGKMMLEKLGYKVLTANSPGQALSVAKEYKESIDVLLTDVVMPEMNGKELARQVQQLFPEIRSIFISGYTANIIAPHGVLAEGVHFIQKPFSMKKLSAKLREVLE